MNGASLLQKWLMVQAIMADPALSGTAKNIAARLLHHLNSKSGRCSPSYETLARGIGLARRRAMAGVQELEKAGWIIVERTSHEKAKGTGGGLPSNSFSFDWERCRATDHIAEDDTNLVPDTALPSAENDTSPSAENGTALVLDLALSLVPDSAPKQGNIKPGIETEKKSIARKPKTDPEEDSGFIELLANYPKRTDQQRAAEEYQRVLKRKDATPEQLLDQGKAFARANAGNELQYIPSLYNWLRRKLWRDEIIKPAARNSRSQPGSYLVEAAFGEDYLDELRSSNNSRTSERASHTNAPTSGFAGPLHQSSEDDSLGPLLDLRATNAHG